MFEKWIEEHGAELKENVFILRSNYTATERQLIALIIYLEKLNWQYRKKNKNKKQEKKKLKEEVSVVSKMTLRAFGTLRIKADLFFN